MLLSRSRRYAADVRAIRSAAAVRRSRCSGSGPVSRTNDLSAPVPYPQDYPQAEKTATAVLEQVNAMLDKAAEPKPAPESVTVRSVPGSPSVEILTTAAAMDADVIVLGSRGAGGFAKLVMGSVSAQVAQHAHCPVVIIPSADQK